MTAPTVGPDRIQSVSEEIANSISHGVGLAASLVATPLLIGSAVRAGRTAFIVGVSVFAASLVLLYTGSTLYHALRPGTAKRVFRIIEHSAIFLLIAGTYTPFTLGALYGAWGWTLFGVVWALALSGVLLNAVGGVRFPRLSMVLYLGMGWMIVIAVRPLWLHVPAPGLIWLAAGGLAYTAGVPFYAAKGRRYAHFVWHLFVLAGTACHLVAVGWYAS